MRLKWWELLTMRFYAEGDGDGGGGDGGASGDGDGDGTSGDGAGADGDGAGTGDAAAKGAPKDGSGQSLIDAAKTAAGKAIPAKIPEKFIVNSAEGKLDAAATLEKVTKAYVQLEAARGSDGVAPDKIEGYELALQEGETELPKFDEKANTAFKALALKAKLTPAQYNILARDGDKFIQEMGAGVQAQTAEAAKSELREFYGGDKGYQEALGKAWQAYEAFASEEDIKNVDSIGNNPGFIRTMAKVFDEMGEHQRPNFDQDAFSLAANEVEALQKDLKSAYWDSKLPGHAAAKAKVQQHYERQANMNARKRA